MHVGHVERGDVEGGHVEGGYVEGKLVDRARRAYARRVTQVRVTGYLPGPDAAHGGFAIEVEVLGGSGRLRFAHGLGPGGQGTVDVLMLDGTPVVVACRSDEGSGTLVLPSTRGPSLPEVPMRSPPSSADVLTERVLAEVVAGLAEILVELTDGLYVVRRDNVEAPLLASSLAPGWCAGGAVEVTLVEAAPLGTSVCARVGAAGARVVLAGAGGARPEVLWVISAEALSEATGFEPWQHDHGAREAFTRSPFVLVEDAALRHAVARLRELHPEASVGPMTEDRLEPAVQQARALVWDLRFEDDVAHVSDLVRVPLGEVTEYRALTTVRARSWEIAFVTRDGRRLDEALVRVDGRFRATGVRPAARALGRVLRALAVEEP